MSASLKQTSLVSLCQPDLTAGLPAFIALQQRHSDGMQVAKTVDINHVSPLLAQLAAYDGMVTLALAKAKALDPEVVAAQKSEAGRLAREVIAVVRMVLYMNLYGALHLLFPVCFCDHAISCASNSIQATIT